MTLTVTILIVDDLTVLRARIRSLVNMVSNFEVAGEADDGKEEILCTTQLNSDIITSSVIMPVANGTKQSDV